MFNAKPLQVSFVLLQSADGFANIANPSLRFHDFHLTVVAVDVLCRFYSVENYVPRHIRRSGLFARLFFSRFSKTYAEATAVRVDELDARRFEAAKSELKKLMPEDAKEASGHGIRAKRSKSGAVSFDLSQAEATDAALQ